MTNLLSAECALKLKQLLVLLSALLVTSVFSSCAANTGFSDAPPTREQETIETISKAEPSLAVRATSCRELD